MTLTLTPEVEILLRRNLEELTELRLRDARRPYMNRESARRRRMAARAAESLLAFENESRAAQMDRALLELDHLLADLEGVAADAALPFSAAA